MPRNFFMQQLFNALTEAEFTEEQRNQLASSAIKGILATQSALDIFKRENPGVTLEQDDEVGLDLDDDDYMTPLCSASKNRHTAIVEKLLLAKADPNIIEKSNNGATPLAYAAFSGIVNTVRALLVAKAHVNQGNTSNGASPLAIAAQAGHAEVVSVLIAAKADFSQSVASNGVSPFAAAVYNGHMDVVIILLAAKANLNEINELVTPPMSVLDYAMSKNQFSIVCLLLKYNVAIQLVRFNAYLASQDQNNPMVLECLQLIAKKNLAQENIKDYTEKLFVLHDSYKTLFSYMINKDFNKPLPRELTTMIQDYDGRFFRAPVPVAAITYMQPATVDAHLYQLKEDILVEKYKEKIPMFFAFTLKNIDALLEEKQEKPITTISPRRVSKNHKCRVM